MTVRNPFIHAVELQVRLVGPEGRERTQAVLWPGLTADLGLFRIKRGELTGFGGCRG